MTRRQRRTRGGGRAPRYAAAKTKALLLAAESAIQHSDSEEAPGSQHWGRGAQGARLRRGQDVPEGALASQGHRAGAPPVQASACAADALA